MRASLPPATADYLAAHHVMTLATQGSDGPWAAAVFYASIGNSLIFLSSPSTRHGGNLAADPRCSATIQEDYDDWRKIKGLQIEGRVALLAGEDEQRAKRLYGEKFPLLNPAAKLPSALVKAIARVSWYLLTPSRIYFIDNSQGFGHRDRFKLG